MNGSAPEEKDALDIGQLYNSCKWVQHLKRLGKKEAAVDGSAAKEGEAVDIGQLYSSCKWV